MRFFLAAVLAVCLLADDAPKGVPAKPSPSDYAAKANWHDVTFAATLIPAKQVAHLFAFDISKSYVVFEVACYADSGASLNLTRQAFMVNSAHNAEPETVAAFYQRQNMPPMPSHTGSVETAATIGYEHGTDPMTGRSVNGVYTAGTVGVGQGNGPETAPPPPPKPGSTSEDRRMLEAQLRARSLPEGPISRPLAGYLFFRKTDLKVQPGDTYALQYMAEETPVTLSVPRKTR